MGQVQNGSEATDATNEIIQVREIGRFAPVLSLTTIERQRNYKSGGAPPLLDFPFSQPIILSRYGPIAQLVEQLTLNQRVAGSSPARLTILNL